MLDETWNTFDAATRLEVYDMPPIRNDFAEGTNFHSSSLVAG